VESVYTKNVKMFEFNEEVRLALHTHFNRAERDSIEKYLYFEWMLEHVDDSDFSRTFS
jgi:hypothetical protein